MSDELVNPEKNSATPLIPASLIEELDIGHLRHEEMYERCFDHVLQCCGLLLKAKAAVPTERWDRWLADHFDGIAEAARYYMEYDHRYDGTAYEDEEARVLRACKSFCVKPALLLVVG